jgi:hypothetical protein
MSAPNTAAATGLGTPALPRQAPSDLRNELTDMVIRDLLGPAGGPDEELNQYEDHAYQRYLVGMLAPKDEEVDAGELDELATGDGDEGEEGAPESGVPAGNTYFPSSMGLSFIVAAETKEIVIEADWGQYLRVKSDTQIRKTAMPPTCGKENQLSRRQGPCRSRTATLSPSRFIPSIRWWCYKAGCG